MQIIGLALAAVLAGAGQQDTPPHLAKVPQPINPGRWLTDSDYPSSARRQGIHGMTTFRLDVDASGKVTNCTVTGSSGSDLLDRTTCDLLLKRARFVPAQDGWGRNIPFTFTNRFVWRQ
jgi:protein TonB